LLDQGDETEANKYRLYGVRLDTSSSVRDISVPPLGDAGLDLGVTPRLVFNVRSALDHAWEAWDLPKAWREPRARNFCRHVRIVVSGGFTPDRSRALKSWASPPIFMPVGSWLFNNSDHAGTVTDFTADVVGSRSTGNGWTWSRWVASAATILIYKRYGRVPRLHVANQFEKFISRPMLPVALILPDMKALMGSARHVPRPDNRPQPP